MAETSTLPLPPEDHQGPFCVCCTVIAKDDKGNDLEKCIAKVRASAESPREPDCITYRPTRDLKDRNKFYIFEKYTNVDALKIHYAQPAFQELIRKGIADFEARFSEEIDQCRS